MTKDTLQTSHTLAMSSRKVPVCHETGLIGVVKVAWIKPYGSETGMCECILFEMQSCLGWIRYFRREVNICLDCQVSCHYIVFRNSIEVKEKLESFFKHEREDTKNYVSLILI